MPMHDKLPGSYQNMQYNRGIHDSQHTFSFGKNWLCHTNVIFFFVCVAKQQVPYISTFKKLLTLLHTMFL